MVTATEERRIRLANDHVSMENIRRDWLGWKAVSGIPPQVDGYELSIKVRTIISSAPTYRDTHTIHLSLPSDYPNSPPQARMTTAPPPFHPNWFTDGRWCPGPWGVGHESLGEFVVRLIQTLQYNLYITNERSPANVTARDWYVQNQTRGLFPCDRTPLPDPSTGRFRVMPAAKPKFKIK